MTEREEREAIEREHALEAKHFRESQPKLMTADEFVGKLYLIFTRRIVQREINHFMDSDVFVKTMEYNGYNQLTIYLTNGQAFTIIANEKTKTLEVKPI